MVNDESELWRSALFFKFQIELSISKGPIGMAFRVDTSYDVIACLFGVLAAWITYQLVVVLSGELASDRKPAKKRTCQAALESKWEFLVGM